jgi:hypothetical protein
VVMRAAFGLFTIPKFVFNLYELVSTILFPSILLVRHPQTLFSGESKRPSKILSAKLEHFLGSRSQTSESLSQAIERSALPEKSELVI